MARVKPILTMKMTKAEMVKAVAKCDSTVRYRFSEQIQPGIHPEQNLPIRTDDWKEWIWGLTKQQRCNAMNIVTQDLRWK